MRCNQNLITQALRPGFKFRLRFCCCCFFFVFFPRSVTNRRLVSKAHAPPLHAYSTWNLQRLSSRKVSTDSMISRAMKSHTNEHNVQGRPTLKDVNYERSICKRTFWVNHESCYTKGAINRGYQLFNLIKSILRSVFVFLDVIVNQAESQHELKNAWATRAERLENLFTNLSVRVHLSKMLWETSLSIVKIKSGTKRYFLVICL